ncbi:hypothetical protein NAT51_08070 [Flavobacterium amniphilum]|uniref:hypothetical protein n=1 Tax=Flavobacterium amniphilum TaxID=1834035 RepID=UPI00202A4EAD|nr:hypothetical protein [Flavobacterium amniphilum]MCL9805474.1 hypothetical protein [Flavobacterium amniphilum]
MKRYILILTVLFLTFCACNNHNGHKENVTVIPNDVFLKETNDGSKTTKQILDEFSESVLELVRVDTTDYFYGENVIEDDSAFRQILVGKFIDQTKIIATEINIKDSVINFYLLDNENWKLIGSEKTNIPIYRIDFEDLDGDNRSEIITSSNRNMNGNTWQEVYYCSSQSNTIHYAGSYSTEYVIKKDKKQIEETYEGSSYMNASKTLYEWKQEKLVPIRQIILAQDQSAAESGNIIFEYYENSTNDIEGLKLKFKEPYDDNKKQKELWDNFFNKQ